MTVIEARGALLRSVTTFGEAMCRMNHAGAQAAIHDIDDKIAVLIEAAKAEQAAACLVAMTTVQTKGGHA